MYDVLRIIKNIARAQNVKFMCNNFIVDVMFSYEVSS